ncbi:MAG TPA: ABC transporter ATP-binding protein [Chthoniobacterales bacterium]|nr:ABC transporter ATP-binding protein [Chthoniobacterales bacterium]
MSSAAVSVRSLTKIYPLPFRRGQVRAVRDLNLEIDPGQVYGLLGPNGSGKSTTLKTILGLVWPSSGETRIFGKSSREVASRAEVGFLPENPYFYKYLTAEETLRFFGRLSGLDRKSLPRRIDELLGIVGLTAARKRRLATYSKGMLQRIGLAQAMIHNPRLLVLDEPTAGVDPVGSREICNLILSLKSQGITVLLSSHLLAQAQEICDRVAILAEGILVREGRLEDLISRANQTDVVVENASTEMLSALDDVVNRHGGRLVAHRKSTRTLEELFLEATGGGTEPK